MKLTIDKFNLGKKLGEGGNGVVFAANLKENPEELLAIKILKNERVNQKLYGRFETEISFLNSEKSNDGILPIIHYHLPTYENLETEKAWYTMPIAIPVTKYISRNNLGPTDIIKLFVDYSNTLVSLNSQGTFHRDIKPDNLFVLNDKPVIGDFGLVKYPSRENKTDNKKLGPIFFIAPEMLNTPDNADYEKVDVYSLAKSLWVLLTNQTYPIPGEHDLSYEPIHLTTYVEHPRINILDVLLNRATKLNASQRIKMNEFNTELLEWLNPKKVNAELMDIEDQAKQLNYILQPNIDNEEHRRYLSYIVEKVNRDIGKDSEKALENIESKLPQPFNGGSNPTIINAESLIGRGQTNNDLISREGICKVITTEFPIRIYLWLGWGSEAFKDETIQMAVGYRIRVGHNGTEENIWSMTKSAKAQTAELENCRVILVEEFIKGLPTALNRFIEESKKASR